MPASDQYPDDRTMMTHGRKLIMTFERERVAV
jgi:hypothetical protein